MTGNCFQSYHASNCYLNWSYVEYCGFQMGGGTQCHGSSFRLLLVYPLGLDSTTRFSTVNGNRPLLLLCYKPFQFEYAWHIFLILQYENIFASIDYLTCNVDDCLKWLRHVFLVMLSLCCPWLRFYRRCMALPLSSMLFLFLLSTMRFLHHHCVFFWVSRVFYFDMFWRDSFDWLF